MAGMFPERNPELDFIINYVPGGGQEGKFKAVELDPFEDDDWDEIPEKKITGQQVMLDRFTIKDSSQE